MAKRLFPLVLFLLLCLSAVVGWRIGEAGKEEAAPGGTDVQQCHEYMIFGLRGTGAAPGAGTPAEAVAAELKLRLGRENVSLEGSAYPAQQDSLEEYQWSVEQGRESAVTWLITKAEECPDSKFLLIGFSQGAHSAHLAMATLKEESFLKLRASTWALLINDPLRDPADPGAEDFLAGRGPQGIGDYLYTGDGKPVLLGAAMRGHVLSVCHAEDFVCNHSDRAITNPTLANPHRDGWAIPEAQHRLLAWTTEALSDSRLR